MSDDPLIRLTKACVEFPAVPTQRRGLGHLLPGHSGAIGGHIRREGRQAFVRSLDSIDLELVPGTRLGLIGSNGSGKSTLLRLIAGIYEPDNGSVEIRGHVSTVFSSTIGMNVNATALQNIRDIAGYHRIPRSQVDDLVRDVVEFSEIGDFAALPMRTYSAGMRARVGFGVATSVKPDILLIDEMINAGDAGFREKAGMRMERLVADAGIVVVASHSRAVLNQFCDELVWLDRGVLRERGPVECVYKSYSS